MPLEIATSIESLNDLWPLDSDLYAEGDNHIRMIKSILKSTFPSSGDGFEEVIISTESEWNNVSGTTSGIQDQINAIHGGTIGAGGDLIAPYNTVCMFAQAAAPTGWVQITTYDDYQLRLVNTAGGSTGGSDSPFSFPMTHSHTTSGFTLTEAHMPSHKHNSLTANDSNTVVVNADGKRYAAAKGSAPLLTETSNIEYTGGGESHTHGNTLEKVYTFQPQYLNMILARSLWTPSVPDPTVYWTLDATSFISGAFQPSPDVEDNRLTVTGSVPAVAGYIEEGAGYTNSVSNYMVAGGPYNRVEELDVQEHTLSCWVKATATGASQALISNCVYPGGSGSASNSGTWIRITPSGRFEASLYVQFNESYTDSNGNAWNSYAIAAAGSFVITPGVWYHVVGTFEANSAKLFIDGVLDSSVTSSQSQVRKPTDAEFSIGVNIAAGGAYYPFNGVIDEIKCWDEALSPGVVTALYNSYA